MRISIASVLLVSSTISSAFAAGGFDETGSDSFYWHARYHGLLAMAGYGDFERTCPQTFTTESMRRNYPSSTEQPFTVLSKWGPTPKYNLTGYIVRVPEMNKVLTVIPGVYGWQDFNATLAPLLGVGCDSTCMAHAGAIEAYHEVKNATNDFQAQKNGMGSHVWSMSGHGFGAMVAQIAALDLKVRGLAYSCMHFGSPPVFNKAAAARYNYLFPDTESQRGVSHEDAVPTYLPLGNGSDYQHVNTGFHTFGYSGTYGEDYRVCYDSSSSECLGGNVESDHYHYFTTAGHCGETDSVRTYNSARNQNFLASFSAAYKATHAEPVGSAVTSVSTVSSTLESSSAVESSTASAAPAITTSDPVASNPAPAAASSTPSSSAIPGAAGKVSSDALWSMATLIAGLMVLA